MCRFQAGDGSRTTLRINLIDISVRIHRGLSVELGNHDAALAGIRWEYRVDGTYIHAKGMSIRVGSKIQNFERVGILRASKLKNTVVVVTCAS